MNATFLQSVSSHDRSVAHAAACNSCGKVRLLWMCLLAATLSLSTAQGAPIVPSGLSPGDKYHLVFVTSTLHQGDFGDGTYAPGGNLPGVLAGDFIVNSTTVGGNQPGALTATANYKAILSDSTRDAISLVTDSSPVYNVLGQLVAPNYASMFQGSSTSLVNPIRYDEFGNSATFGAWTGTTSAGLDSGLTGGDWTGASGPLTRGAPSTGSSSWVNSGANSSFVQALRLYGISEQLMVPVPEPAGLALIVGSAVVACCTHRRRRISTRHDAA